MINYNEKRYKNIIGKNVERYRLKNSYTQENLADIVGCKQQTINSIEKGRIKRSKYLPYIASALGVNIADLDPDLNKDQNKRAFELTHSNNHKENINSDINTVNIHDVINEHKSTSNYLKKINSDIPIFATIKELDNYFLITNTPVEYIPRPHLVNLEKDAFGIIIGNHAMYPLFRVGDVIVVHPRKTVKEHDICIFIGYENGLMIYTIGELIHEDALSWTVRQYKLYCNFSLPKTVWKKCNAIIIKIFR